MSMIVPTAPTLLSVWLEKMVRVEIFEGLFAENPLSSSAPMSVGPST